MHKRKTSPKSPIYQDISPIFLFYWGRNFAHLWNIIRLLFPFKYPINPETLILGGILTGICIWSGHISPSVSSTPFHAHSFRNISLISNLFSAKNTSLRYFGANTMWYLQFHFVCAKLFVIFSCSVMNALRLCMISDRQVISHCTQSEFFCLFHRL